MHDLNGGQKLFLPCRGCGERPVVELMEDGVVRAFCCACRANTGPVLANSVISLWNWRFGDGAMVRRNS